MKSYLKLFLLFVLINCITEKTFAQCFQIESILADACDTGNNEGFNEMVRFKVGATAINTSNMNVNWPANTWQGLIQNATTATKVAQLNAQITSAGGCGLLIQPTAGVLPANAKVILVSSYNFNVAFNYFGAITENYYIIFQDNATQTNGHFGNYSATPGVRTLVINFGVCTDSVSYQRSSLININGTSGGGSAVENGATINFTPSGTATYVNAGCVAPVDVSEVDAGNSAVTACQGTTIVLAGTSQNTQTGSSTTWSANNGTFSNVNSLTSSYTLNPATTGSVVLTLSGTNQCGATITDTITVNITNLVTPNFVLQNSICSGSVVPTLNATSPNGISGTWSPSAISNTASNTYIFTPTANSCATTFSKTITINNQITPDFVLPSSICSGATAPTLNNTSANGISGTWSPNAISNTASNTYVFSPTANSCATTFSITINVNNQITPDFVLPNSICSGATAPTLNTTSPNGISGTWTPTSISNTTSNTYIFTPAANSCATSFSKTITIDNQITPDFVLPSSICSGATTPTLNATSPNGVSGTWSPNVISNTTSNTYVFTPSANSCATNFSKTITINNQVTPDFVLPSSICSGAAVPTLNATSPNGISGTWSPTSISNTTSNTYVFTPTANNCATTFSITINVNNQITPDFVLPSSICSGSPVPTLNATSPNGISGTWSPNAISNTASNTYVFTPAANSCATNFSKTITINNQITPDFVLPSSICSGSAVPTLNATSPNGVSGTWSPNAISNTTSNTYVFMPSANSCATQFSKTITINNQITPDFVLPNSICSGSAVPILNTTSPNGISGTWSPNAISNTISNTYVFTPTSNSCATSFSITINVNQNITPTFDYVLPICTGQFLNDLPQTSTNNISGNWSPAINNQSTTEYTFVPNPNQCATNQKLTIVVNARYCDIQKGISPNGDKLNDNFDLSLLNVKQLNIFNRYGAKVYSKTNYSNEWFGQTDTGNSLPDATYFYEIELSNQEVKTGWIYINKQV